MHVCILLDIFYERRIKNVVCRGSSRSRKLRLEKCYPDHIITSSIDWIEPSLHWFKVGTARIINDTVSATVSYRGYHLF